MPPFFERHVERVVGKMSDTEKDRSLQELHERFDDQAFESLRGKEREKSAEELEIIALANTATNGLRRRYGLDKFDIPEKNIHVIKKSDWSRSEKGNALYNSMLQGVAVQEQDANTVFLKKMIHEMIHFKSYTAAQMIAVEHPTIEEYRLGLIVHSRDGMAKYFTNFNEAVTEEITKSIFEQLRHHPLCQREVEQTQHLASRYPHATDSLGKPFFDDDTFYAYLADKTAWENRTGRVLDKVPSQKLVGEQFGYRRERNILKELTTKIFENNPNKFRSMCEVDEVFIKAMVTGDILPLGRLIDGTFGKGTLRKIGELDSDVDKQAELIRALQVPE
jgi:hypothetical protein